MDRGPSGEQGSYNYDPAGKLTSRAEATGATTYSCDKLNRLDQVDDPDPRQL